MPEYPKENEYVQYLAKHSGSANAVTTGLRTSFYFEVAAKSGPDENQISKSGNVPHHNPKERSPLYGALERFSQFFIAPLFSPEMVHRELEAVDSEHKKNLRSDGRRLFQLQKSLSSPSHPFCHFQTGNLRTLRYEPVSRGVEIRDECIKFCEREYSANRMKLVVLGAEPVDILQIWVEEFFNDIVNKSLKPNRWDGLPWVTHPQMRKLVFAKPVTERCSLKIDFPFVDEEQLIDERPGRYLSHLVGHEGPGSILAYLKRKGWAYELAARSMDVCPGSPGMFTISVDLTNDGQKNYEEVARVCFEYLAILHETPPQEWIFNEVKAMAEIDFRFEQKISAWGTTSILAKVMQTRVPRSRLLKGASMPHKFRAEAIREATSRLKADNVHLLTLVTKDHPPGRVEKEKWYETEFVVQDIPDKFLNCLYEAEQRSASQRLPSLYLPTGNQFIPSRFDVDKSEVPEPAKTPKLIRHGPNLRVWYKKDDQFWVPQANIKIHFRIPACGADARAFAMTAIIRALIEDSLSEYTYDLRIAGLEYSLSQGSTGIGVSVSGYNDKMSVLFEKICRVFRDVEIQEDRFAMIKERITRGYKDVEYMSPHQQVVQCAECLTVEGFYENSHLLNEIDSVTVEHVRAFHSSLVQEFHIEMLVHGNVHRGDALTMADMVVSILHPQELPQSQWPIRRSVMLPPASHYVHEHPLKDEHNVNHCVEYMLQIGHAADFESRARLLVFAEMTQEPAFDQLRTKEQLGYIVLSGRATQEYTDFYCILVQSERPCNQLEKRIDSFLANFRAELVGMSEEKFEVYKRSSIQTRLQKPKNLHEECARFWEEITSESMRFEAPDDDAARIEKLEKWDLIEFYDTFVNPSSKRRAKLSVHMLAKPSPEAANADVLVQLGSDVLMQMQVAVNEVELKSGIDAVDLRSPSIVDDVANAMTQYLQLSGNVQDEEQIKLMKQPITVALRQSLASLEIGVPKLEAPIEGAKPAEKFEDIDAWKARQQFSTAVTSFKDLSVFEDLENEGICMVGIAAP